LYTTTRDTGIPAVASAIVVAPAHPPAGPRPVIAWTHGTTGVAEECAPSLLPHPFTAGALFVLPQILAQGWVLVATDYTGMGTTGPSPFLIGQGEARSDLDAVRAAHQLTQLNLADQTVLWGHSQGGHAALWAGILAPAYAPDVHVVGVAALAAAADLTGLVDGLAHVPGGSIFSAYAITAYSQAYRDVGFNQYVRPAAQIISRRAANRCLSGPGVLVSAAQSLALDKPIFTGNPATGALGQRLVQNTPAADVQAPLLIAQGLADPLVLPSVQAQYVRQRCAAGQKLDYLTYPGQDHVGLVAADSPLIPALISWTKNRLAGKPAPDTCATP
jgi:pimeloyl-ACP methyl ester carboxylesterase